MPANNDVESHRVRSQNIDSLFDVPYPYQRFLSRWLISSRILLPTWTLTTLFSVLMMENGCSFLFE